MDKKQDPKWAKKALNRIVEKYTATPRGGATPYHEREFKKCCRSGTINKNSCRS